MDTVFGLIVAIVLTAVVFFFAMAFVNLVFIVAVVLALLVLPWFIQGFLTALREGDDEGR